MSGLILPTHLDGALVNTATGAGAFHGYSNARGNWQQGGFVHIPEEYRSVLDAESPECHRVCEVLPNEMTREWVSLEIADGDSKLVSKAEEYDRRLQLRDAFRLAQYHRRMDDGAIVVLSIDDGKKPDEPVDEKRIRTIYPVRAQDVLSRWMVLPSDFSGYPEYYQIYSYSSVLNGRGERSEYEFAGWQGRVHHSRVLRFDDDMGGRYVRQRNSGWTPGALHRFIPAYIQYFNVLDALGQIVQKSSIMTYTIRGLMQIFLDGQEEIVRKRLSENLMAASVYGAYIKDEDEQLAFAERNMSGYDQVVDRFERSLLVASGYPHSYLLGRTGPNGGLDGNGNAEAKLMAQLAGQEQEKAWRKLIEKMYRYIFLAKDGPTKGKDPPRWSIAFKNLYQATPQEEAELRLTVAQADSMEMGGGVLTAEDIVRSHYSQPHYNPTITIDWERKEEELKQAKEQSEAQAQPEEEFGYSPDEPNLENFGEEAPAEEGTESSAVDSEDWEHIDRKGQGKPCGKGFISVSKKCSSDKVKQLAADLRAGDEGAKARVKRGRELAQSRQQLKRQVERDRGKKSEPIDDRSLEDLFLESERIGNKYQTKEEREKFQSEMNQIVGQISEEIDRQFPEQGSVVDYSKPSRKPAQAPPKNMLPKGVSKLLKPKKFDSLDDRFDADRILSQFTPEQFGCKDRATFDRALELTRQHLDARSKKTSAPPATAPPKKPPKPPGPGNKPPKKSKASDTPAKPRRLGAKLNNATPGGGQPCGKGWEGTKPGCKRAKAKNDQPKEKKPKAKQEESKPEPQKRNPFQIDRSDPKQLEALGKAFTDHFIKEGTPEEFQRLREAIARKAGISKQQAEELVASTNVSGNAVGQDPYVKRNLSDFYQLTGASSSATLKNVVYAGDRAFANKEKQVVSIGKGLDVAAYKRGEITRDQAEAVLRNKRQILFHEAAHHLEYNNPEILQAATQWIKNKAEGEPRKLSELTGNPGYGDHEVAYPDKFLTPYIGKATKTGNTEVISMGLERFATAQDMQRFFSNPNGRDHFNFIVGVLVGEGKPKS